MDTQKKASSQIVDHRKIVTRGWPSAIALLLGLILGRVTGTGADPQRDLVLITSTALDRGDNFWGGRLDPGLWRAPHVLLVDHDHGESTPCGRADAASGPFYCPANERIYLDLDFIGAISGELARAYVTAHELGHHVQKLRGELGRSSISTELGADCYAGMWMHQEQLDGHLGSGDLANALLEAAAVGDDRICPSCSPEQWTHGSSTQRMDALTEGFRGGTCGRWNKN